MTDQKPDPFLQPELSPKPDHAAEQMQKTEPAPNKPEIKQEAEAEITATPEELAPRELLFEIWVGGSSLKDATEDALALIEHAMSAPKSAHYMLRKVQVSGQDFWFLEAHIGGQKRPYLPEIAKQLSADMQKPMMLLRSDGRYLRIKYDMNINRFERLLLPTGSRPNDNDYIAQPSKSRMRPFEQSGISFLLGGVAFAMAGLIAFTAVNFANISDHRTWMEPRMKTLDLSLLPIMQLSQLQPPGHRNSYVASLRFEDNAWSVSRKATDGLTVKGQLAEIQKQVRAKLSGIEYKPMSTVPVPQAVQDQLQSIANSTGQLYEDLEREWMDSMQTNPEDKDDSHDGDNSSDTGDNIDQPGDFGGSGAENTPPHTGVDT